MAARGRGRAVQVAPVDPAQAQVPCDLPASFFSTLPNGNWPLFLTSAAPFRCLTCRHEPHLHLFAAPVVPPVAAAQATLDPLLRRGPAPVLPLTPGETLRAILSEWRGSVILPEDREKWERCFTELSSLLFDSFSLVLLEHLDVVGTSAGTRKWTVREGLNEDAVARLSMALRLSRDLGMTIISIMRLEQRYKWKSLGLPMLMIDGDRELPVAIFVAEAISKTSTSFVPGARLPPSSVLSDPSNPQWWGILAATIPIDAYVATVREFFGDYVTIWCAKSENKGLVVSAAAFRATRARRAADEAHLAAAAAVVGRRQGPPSVANRPANHLARRRQLRDNQPDRSQVSAPPSAPTVSVPTSGALSLVPQSGRGRGRGGRGRFGGGNRDNFSHHYSANFPNNDARYSSNHTNTTHS